jgi:hypothetical protein
MGDCELDSHGSTQRPVVGSSEYGNDLQVAENAANFLNS